ncbi:MAG: amidohydrolase family protein [Bacillota bacterium]|nr:amidohydrolase family protein [Bacillota bacterium]
MAFDTIIRNGEVIDGTGAARKKADVGIKGDSIAAVGDLSGAAAGTVVDASGQVVTPGFIDMHSHSDQTILMYPCGQSSIGQGITTTLGGQCGFSPAPLNKHYTAGFWEWNWWDDVEHRKYYQEVVTGLAGAKVAAKKADGLDIDWATFAQWLDRVEAAKPGLNFAPLVGHSTVRSAVMGQDYRRHASPAEVAAMKGYVAEAMAAGARGISNGMDYAPNSYCAPEESHQVIGEAAKEGGVFCSHWRRTGLRQGFGNPGLVDGLREAIDIAKKTGVRLELAHLAAGYLMAPSATPKLSACAAEETLAVLDEAIKDGVDLAFDVIPNHLTGGVIHVKYLAAMLTPWWKEAGTFERFAFNLTALDLRQEIKEYIYAGKWHSLNPVTQPKWADNARVGKCSAAKYEGKTIAQIAAEEGIDQLDALMDVLAADPHTIAAGRTGDVDETKNIFYKHPRAMVGVDTFLVDETNETRVPPYYLPNQNSFGGMARFIRLYALGLLGLEEGVRHITSLPAKTLNLSDRGTLAAGMKADIVVFKPDSVKEKLDAEEPRLYPEGFIWVFVNGTAALAEGKFTLSRTGRVLRR